MDVLGHGVPGTGLANLTGRGQHPITHRWPPHCPGAEARQTGRFFSRSRFRAQARADRTCSRTSTGSPGRSQPEAPAAGTWRPGEPRDAINPRPRERTAGGNWSQLPPTRTSSALRSSRSNHAHFPDVALTAPAEAAAARAGTCRAGHRPAGDTRPWAARRITSPGESVSLWARPGGCRGPRSGSAGPS